MVRIGHGLRSGNVKVPPSKSHLHRLLIASFLSGKFNRLEFSPEDCDDIIATKRCLLSLLNDGSNEPILDCGESASTLRFLSPIIVALGKKAKFLKKGRLAERPNIEYKKLLPGRHEIKGNISSQFISALLFALPLLKGESEIVLTTPLESKGYVDLTLDVLKESCIKVEETSDGYFIPGSQEYKLSDDWIAEDDWSAIAFWLAANSIGNKFELPKLNFYSKQPDVKIAETLRLIETSEIREIDVSSFPDSFPVLSIVAACTPGKTKFKGLSRLRIKESDRVQSMIQYLKGSLTIALENNEELVISGTDKFLNGGEFSSFHDHRIAMAIILGATRSSSDVFIDDISCINKSYPTLIDRLLSR